MIGVLLAFLVVFRSQIAWGMYMEGRNAVGRVVAMSRCLALELLASLAHACVEEGISERAIAGSVAVPGGPATWSARRCDIYRSCSAPVRTKKSDIGSRSATCSMAWSVRLLTGCCTIGRRSSMCARATARRRGLRPPRWSIASPRRRRSPS